MSKAFVLLPLLLVLYPVTKIEAAPKLRLSTAALGPFSIASGQNGPAQTVEAYNAGDGSLSLSVASSATWAVATVGTARACTTRSGNCLPIQIALQTASLEAGSQTAIVTVRDPNAVDAPQTITVTVQIGGGVPSQLNFFLAPNGSSRETTFMTNSLVTTRTNAPWLALMLDGIASMRFSYPYKVRVTHQPGQGEGTYAGSATVSNSSFAPDNKTIAVNLRVTSEPIARMEPARLQFRVAQGAAAQTQNLVITNSGLGSLSVTAATPTTASGGEWLKAGSFTSPVLPVTADIQGLSSGRYTGSIAITSNAVNGPLQIPVDLEVVESTAPVIAYQGVVDNTTFERGGSLSPGMIAVAFGEQLSYSEPTSASSLPLGTELGGVRVLVNDQPVPVYYSSYGQVNFQVPYNAPAGTATVRLERNGQRGNAVSVEIAERAPRLLRLGIGNYGIIVNQDGSFPIPATAGIPSHPAARGDVLVIYAIGLGQTDPPVQSGAAAPGVEPLPRVPGFSVYFGGGLQGTPRPITPLYMGLTPTFVGLYQINVQVPPDAPSGVTVPVYLHDGQTASNLVEIAIE